MNNELRNREARLRRSAAKKGLFIRKRKWRIYCGSIYEYNEYQGYCVGFLRLNIIIFGGDSNDLFLPTLEEAEEFVAEY